MSKPHISKPQSQEDGVQDSRSNLLIDSQKEELGNVMASKKISLEELSLGFKSKVPYYQEKYGNEKYIAIMGQALGNALLTDEERVSESVKLLGRELTEEQQQAIIEAHNYGGEDAIVFTYSMEANAVKLKKLIEAGFSLEEATTLTDYGICGKAGKALYQVLNALKTSFSDFYRKEEVKQTEGAIAAYHIYAGVLLSSILIYMTEYDWQTVFGVVNGLPYGVRFLGKMVDLVGEWSGELPSEEQKTILRFLSLMSHKYPDFPKSISGHGLKIPIEGEQKWNIIPNNETIPVVYMSQKYEINEIYFTSPTSALLHTKDDKQLSIDLDGFKISLDF